MKYSTSEEFCWLVGLLEGEACFTLVHMGRHNNLSPRISVGMTDHDTICRVKNLLGAKKIHVRKPKVIEHRPAYSVCISGKKAIEWMKRLAPHMMSRRRERIETILSEWADYQRKIGKLPKEQLPALGKLSLVSS